MDPFNPGNSASQAQGFANLLPNSKDWRAKNIPESNIAKLIKGLSTEVFKLDQFIQDVANQNDIQYTTDFIDQWEKAFGIPNDSFDINVSIVQRRAQVLATLRAQGCTTVCDFIRLIEGVFGYTNVSIVHGVDFVQYPPYAVPFLPSNSFGGMRWTWYIYGDDFFTLAYPPYNVPFLPTDAQTPMTRFVQKLKPANTILIFRNNPVPNGISKDTCPNS